MNCPKKQSIFRSCKCEGNKCAHWIEFEASGKMHGACSDTWLPILITEITSTLKKFLPKES